MKSTPLFRPLVLILVLLSSVVGAEAPTGAEAVLGQYWSPKKDAKIEIYQQGDRYFGKFIWTQTEGKKDDKNPDPALRSRLIKGSVFLRDFRHENGKYVGGSIYDPKSGKTYQSSMWLEGPNLKVRGFVGISALGRTELFERL
ncbi:DUF2147 domain-containing protein [bacterium]|nr:DUF2147 domain-containing protein [bacterium]